MPAEARNGPTRAGILPVIDSDSVPTTVYWWEVNLVLTSRMPSITST